MTTLTVRQVAAIKRNAKNVSDAITKRDRVIEKMTTLKAEYDSLIAQIDAQEAGTKAISGGFTSEDLLTKVVKTRTNNDGTITRMSEWVPKENVLVYNEETKRYEINMPSNEGSSSLNVANEYPMEAEPVDSQLIAE